MRRLFLTFMLITPLVHAEDVCFISNCDVHNLYYELNNDICRPYTHFTNPTAGHSNGSSWLYDHSYVYFRVNEKPVLSVFEHWKDVSRYENEHWKDMPAIEEVTTLDSKEGAEGYFNVKTCLNPWDWFQMGDNDIRYASYAPLTAGIDRRDAYLDFSVSIQTNEGRSIEVCNVRIDRDKTDRGETVVECGADMEITLEDLAPGLALYLEEMERYVEDLLKEAEEYEADFQEKIGAVSEAFELVDGATFDDLIAAYFENVESALALYTDLHKEHEVLQQEVVQAQKQFDEEVASLEQDINKSLEESGINQDDYEAPFSWDLPAIEIPDFGAPDPVEEQIILYENYAQTTLADLRVLYNAGDNERFLLRIKSWVDSSERAKKILATRRFQSPKEWEAFNSAYSQVEEYVYSVVGRDFWFHDSPVSEAHRDALAKVRRQYERQGAIMERELRTWRGQTITPEQERILDALSALGEGVQAVLSAPGHLNSGIDRLVNSATNAVVEGTTCAAKVVAAADFGDFYELVYGRNLCDGSVLNATDRIFAGVGLVIGNGHFWRGVADTAGLTSKSKAVVNQVARLEDALDKHPRIRAHAPSMDVINSLVKDEAFMNGLPSGVDDLVNILAAAKNPLDPGTAAKLVPLSEHLENVRSVVLNHSGVEGFSRLMVDLKNPAMSMQDGVTHMVHNLAKIERGRVEKVDYKFSGDGVKCKDCRFDVMFSKGSRVRLAEYKSRSYDNISNISVEQLTEYFRGIDDLDEIQYVFNKLKTPDVYAVKMKFSEIFTDRAKAEKIYNSLGEVKFAELFGELDDIDQFIDDIATDIDGPNSIYRFLVVR